MVKEAQRAEEEEWLRRLDMLISTCPNSSPFGKWRNSQLLAHLLILTFILRFFHFPTKILWKTIKHWAEFQMPCHSFAPTAQLFSSTQKEKCEHGIVF